MHVIMDRAERLAMEGLERERVREQRYEELRSEFNSTAVRVRAWEKLHGLRLPTSSLHPILRVISASTGIPIAAIRDEQQSRRSAPATQPVADNIETSATQDARPELSPGEQA